MSLLKPVLVVNPQSQGGNLGRRWPELSRDIRRELGSFDELHTEGPGDGTRLARQAIDGGAGCVIAIGGDGTINEVANGFFDGKEPVRRDVSLGILPFGSGGDFRKTIALPKDLELAARRLATGTAKPIDVGYLTYTERGGDTNSRIFVNISSFGVSGVVDEYVNASSKKLGGKISFFLASARASLSYQNQRVRMTFDDDPSTACDTIINTVAVANGRYFGGGMYIAPDAELDDGLFDVVQLGDMSTAEILLQGPRVYRGTHLHLDKVSHRRARLVEAEPLGDDEVKLDVDGETPGILPARFEILPSALSLIV